MLRRTLMLSAAVVVDLASASAADYPSKRVGVHFPFCPGGGVAATGRLIAAKFEKQFKKDFTVLNVSRAGGTIGAARLAKAKADGYIIGVLPVGTATLGQ